MIAQLKASLLALCTLLVFIAGSVHSPHAQAELVAIPALKTRVTDLTQTLSAEQQSQLEAKLANFEQQKGSQIAVLIVPTTQPEDIDQYSIRVVESWKLGRDKQDDGVLILLDVGQKKSRIEVGYGLEGALNDLTAERIRVEVMRPYIRSGDIYGGLNAGVDRIISVIEGEHLPPPSAKAKHSGNLSNLLPVLFFGALISGLALRSALGSFVGSAINGGIVGGALWLIGLALGGAILLGIVAFFITMMLGTRSMNGFDSFPPIGGGGFGGGSDSFSGGGGGFGGGGASGDW